MALALTGKVVPYKKGFGPFPADVYNVAFPNEYHGVSTEQSLAALAALFLLFVVMCMTYSRGGILACVAALVTLTVLGGQRLRGLAVMGVTPVEEMR